MRGIDVSNNNARVDFHAARKQGARFAWLKVSEGTSFIDATYARHRAAAKKAGLRVGGYHFGHPKNDPEQEAEHFLSLLVLRRGDLLPVLDLEDADGRKPSHVYEWAFAFCRYVHGRIGAWPVVYSGDFFMHANMLDTLPGPKWVASYGAKPSRCRWDVWQFSDHGICGLDSSVTRRGLGPVIYRPAPPDPKAWLRRFDRAWILKVRKQGWAWSRVKASWRFRRYKRLGGK